MEPKGRPRSTLKGLVSEDFRRKKPFKSCRGTQRLLHSVQRRCSSAAALQCPWHGLGPSLTQASRGLKVPAHHFLNKSRGSEALSKLLPARKAQRDSKSTKKKKKRLKDSSKALPADCRFSRSACLARSGPAHSLQRKCHSSKAGPH